MKLIRPAVVAAVGVALVLTGPAGAAAPKLAKAKPVVFTDPVGDANGSNRQGTLLPSAPPSAGQSFRKSSDIVSVKLGRVDNKKTVSAWTVTMELVAPPEQATQYRVAMRTAGCTVYYAEYQFPPAGADAAITKGGLVRENCSGTSVFTDVPTTLTGNSIQWTIPVKGAPGDVKLGGIMELLYGQTNVETAAVFPALDQVDMTGSFKVGQ